MDFYPLKSFFGIVVWNTRYALNLKFMNICCVDFWPLR